MAEIYVEDIEVSLLNMSKLILPEALFVIRQAMEGFRKLWERFRNVSVEEEAIGLDCNGNCLVWINTSLEKNYSEGFRFDNASEITREIVELVRLKS